MSAEKPLPNGVPNPFTDDETGLFGLLLEQAGEIGELHKEADEHAIKALRCEEGITCLQWLASRWERQGARAITMPLFGGLLRDLAVFAETGREPGWLKPAREAMGR